MSDAQRDSRVLVLSQRRLSRHLWHAAQFELEDLLADLDDTRVLSPAPQSRQRARAVARRGINAGRRKAGLPRRSPRWEGSASMVRARVDTCHDLFFAVFHHAPELAYLHRLEGWRESSRTAACLLVELWSSELDQEDDYLEVLRRFDVVYVFNPGTAVALQRRLDIPRPRYMPVGVDAQRLAPLPLRPTRVVDVYSYGRRSPAVHAQLLQMAEETGLTYLYDSISGAGFQDHREHRALMGNLLKRSRYALTHTINDSPERLQRTAAEEALSSRYFEGAAAGAVLLGSRPDTPLFEREFPWRDAVMPLAYDETDVRGVLAAHDADPDRLEAARTAGVVGSLSGHDWAHRWLRLLGDVGLSPSDALTRRLQELSWAAEDVAAHGVARR